MLRRLIARSTVPIVWMALLQAAVLTVPAAPALAQTADDGGEEPGVFADDGAAAVPAPADGTVQDLAPGAGGIVAPGPEADPFQFEDLEITGAGDSPRVCARFDRPLKSADQITYSDYLSVAPEADFAVEVSTRYLCLNGLDYGGRYELTLRAGLPAGDDLRLADTVVRGFDVPDRSPAMRFTASGTVIPATGRRALPIQAINVPEAELRVFRLNDRNLLREFSRIAWGSSPDIWDGTTLETESGELVWSGTVALGGARNHSTDVAIPLDGILGDVRSGYYAIVASAELPGTQPGTLRTVQTGQWFVVTDIGLTAWTAENTLTVLARSLGDGSALGGVELSLIARNNDVLATTRTDDRGLASFDGALLRGQGGVSPRAVYATLGQAADDAGAASAAGPGDARGGLQFAALDLDADVIDLSDHGVAGREAPGALDAYLYTERGIYRTGETVHLTALLRGRDTQAITGLPLTFQVLRPDGLEQQSVTVADSGQGGYRLDYQLADTAYTGRWTVLARTGDDGPAIGTVSFLVEDFVPPRMEVSVTVSPEVLRPGETAQLTVQGDYYFGAPAANLNGEALMDLVADRQPFARWADFTFGLEDADQAPGSLAPVSFDTDADGRAVVDVPVAIADPPAQPLKLLTTVSLFDIDGRPVRAQAESRFIHQPWLIGIAPGFVDGAPLEAPAPFRLLAVDPDGAPLAGQSVEWSLYQIQNDWIWTERDGSGEWQRLDSRAEVANGRVTSGDAPVAIAPLVEWGEYELIARDPAGATATSYRFWAGWSSGGTEADSPDKIEVSILESDGQRVRARIVPPFAGAVTVMLADQQIRHVETLASPADGVEVTLDLAQAERPGTYLLATAHMTDRPQALRTPRRAMGAAWIPLGVAEATLDVAVTVPEVVRPRQPLTVPVAVTGASAGAPVHITLAAVDEGVLRLTSYNRPRPEEYFLVQRRLGLRIQDLYGRLVDAGLAPDALVRSGGDGGLSDQLGGLTVRSSRVVSLYSGIVTADADGITDVTLDIPDFNGRLRVMAVAWSADAMGSARGDVTVRDPVVADLTLPRFLAPGDVAALSVNLNNVDLADGTAVTAELAVTGPVALTELSPIRATLDQGAVQAFPVGVQAIDIGEAKFTLTVRAGAETITRDYDLAVRSPNPFVTERVIAALAPGGEIVVSPEMLAGFSPGSATVTVEIGNLPTFDLASVVEDLSLYPYGCTEQTISVALPLLSYSQLVGNAERRIDSLELDRRLTQSVQRVASRQAYYGLFGLWSPLDQAELWLSAYAVDFLLSARAHGLEVPDAVIDTGLSALRTGFEARLGRSEPYAGDAYAALVLARAGQARLSDLRYMADAAASGLPTPMARAQLAAALAEAGDRDRAQAVMGDTLATLSGASQEELSLLRQAVYADQNDRPQAYDYGSGLRDLAAVVALALEHDLAEVGAVAPVALRLRDLMAERDRYLSTQEQLWIIRAGLALQARQGAVSLAINGSPRQGDGLYRAQFTAESPTTHIRNTGETLFQTVSVRGVPRQPLPAAANRMGIARQVFTQDGAVADLSRVRQGDLLVVVLRGLLQDGQQSDPLVVDLLPAGFEPAGIDLIAAPPRRFSWVAERTPLSPVRFSSLRDDRFVAALATGRSWYDPDRPAAFTTAYVVRAVTPGEFIQPGAFVEDMYQPTYHARGSAGRLTVQAAD